MNYKTILKHTLFILTVPTVVVAGYYGVKAFKYYKNKKQTKNDLTKQNKKETKVIPITRKLEKEENQINIKKENWI